MAGLWLSGAITQQQVKAAAPVHDFYAAAAVARR
jgi:hypothetical protein